MKSTTPGLPPGTIDGQQSGCAAEERKKTVDIRTGDVLMVYTTKFVAGIYRGPSRKASWGPPADRVEVELLDGSGTATGVPGAICQRAD